MKEVLWARRFGERMRERQGGVAGIYFVCTAHLTDEHSFVGRVDAEGFVQKGGKVG